MAKPDVPAVHYAERHDGSYAITVSNADAPALRIDSTPEDLRKEVQATFHATLTLSEMRKLRAAQEIGEPAYTAVWDDLVSARAEERLRNLHAIPPATLENGRDVLTSPHHPSYLGTDRGRDRL